VADADVIPIGGRGEPGRGARTTPSAAARALAPTTKRPVKKTPVKKAAPVKRAVPVKRAAPLKKPKPVVEELPSIDADEVAGAVEDAARATFGDADWERRVAELLAFLRRRVTGDYEVDEFGLDAEVTDHFLLTALRPIAERWFRIETRGIENIPTDGGALVVSNHSGTVPIDGLMTGLVIHDLADRHLRALGADLVFTLPFVGELARKGGATLASSEDAERMLSKGELVGVWPEGFKGIGKPFSERYKLQRFGREGFVSAALRTGVPIVPCSVVGAEEIYPLVGNIPSLARLLGVPYIPITPFFPWLGVLGMIPLPSKWLIEFGEPIRTDSYAEGAADDPMLVFNVTDQVRETIQQTLYALLLQRRSVFS
jgi:1-acyl-sn-glycerol-3-phosphate acyltransferase